jgi:SAM domain (Sterile alpha motif)
VDVAGWLRELGLERYEATFRENDVDAELLPTLLADDLKELGITSLGHRRACWKRSPDCRRILYRFRRPDRTTTSRPRPQQVSAVSLR